MEGQSENPESEIKGLRRCINDLTSILALPAMWSGREPSEIVGGLLEVLVDMLGLDLVYMRLEDPTGGRPIEMVRFAQPPSPAISAPEIRVLLDKSLPGDPQKWPLSTRSRIGDREFLIAPRRLGLQGEIGIVIAGSQREDFPSRTEILLFNVAVNQAVITLQQARYLNEQRRLANELDERVAQRTQELATSNQELKSSEARKTAILNSALDCIVTIDHEGRITEFNLAAERTFGCSRDEVLGGLLADVIIPPLFRAQHKRGFARYLSTGKEHVLGRRIEMTAARADGSEFPVELAITRIPLEGPPSFTGCLRDITERKQSMEKLRRSEAYLAEAQRLSHIGSFGWNVPRGEITWSEESFRIFALDPTTKPTLELILKRVHPDDVPAASQFIERVSREGKDFDYEHRLLMPDGGVKHVRIVARAERSGAGELEFVGAVMDVTAPRKTEAHLRASAKIAQSLAAFRAEVSSALSRPVPTQEMLQECAEVMVRRAGAAFARIWTLNPKEDALELQASAGAYTRLDGTHSRIKVGTFKVGLIAQEQQPYATNNVLNDPRIGDKEWARTGGFVSFAGYPLVVDGRTIGVMGMFARHALSEAVTEALAAVADAIAQGIERKRKEDELRRSEAYLAEAQKLSLTGSFGWDVSSDEHFWSNETFRIFEYDASTKVTLQMVLKRVHPDDVPLVKQSIERASHDGQDWELEYRLQMPNDAVKHVHVVAHAIGGKSGKREFVGAVRDVTAARRAEEALRRGQADLARVSRVTTLGELTASIAHEVNQPLGSIVNNANACLSLLMHDAPQLGEIREALLEIIQGTDQASAVISRVRQLVRKAPSEGAVLNLMDVVREVLGLARHELAARQVIVVTGLTDDLPLVKGDRVQLQQVLLNLIVNGMDAMNATEPAKRTLTISGRRETREGESRCFISVEDAGMGFKAEEMDSLFEAFYTTKPQGMGMGLAISRSIIEAHGGRLWAESKQGPGARFLFSLPETHRAKP